MPTRPTPLRQLGYGCLAIALITSVVMYCAGTFSLLIRPSLVQRAPTPTPITPFSWGASPTQPPPTLIFVPPGTLLATPTQAPIPTRELPTATPTPTEALGVSPTFAHTTVTRGAPTATRTPPRAGTATSLPGTSTPRR